MASGMSLGLMLSALAWLEQPAPDQAPSAPEEEEIIIQAVRGKCRVRLDDRVISERALSKRASEWAALGTPIRVVTPHGAGYKCLSKIVFRLNDKGVRLIRFVEPDEG